MNILPILPILFKLPSSAHSCSDLTRRRQKARIVIQQPTRLDYNTAMAKPTRSTLNPQQRQAVEYCDGPLLVLAGAGSGKTRVITEKLAFLIQQRDIPASSIAAITFTNKAAKEMRQRAAKLLPGQQSKQLQVSTFHALGWRMLREHAEQAGYRPGISILDETESTRMLRELLPDNTPPDQLRRQRWLISTAKNAALVDADSVPENVDLLQRYQQQMQRLNAVDFDDLLAIPLQLLHQHKDIRYQWQQRLRHLLVDEYQDTNACQYQLLRLLAGDSGYLTVVGDDDQSIYGWRGAQPDNLRQLQQDFTDLRVIKLEQNYRCSSRILQAANALIGNNPHLFEKKLWSDLQHGDDPRIIPCDDGEQEVERIVGDIHSRIQRGARAGQFAILYRSHHLARPFEQALRAAGIRYRLTGGQSFFDRAEIRDLMAWLRLLVNPDDNPALLRVINTPRREIGASTINHLADHARAQHCSLFDAAVSDACLAGLAPRQRQGVAASRVCRSPPATMPSAAMRSRPCANWSTTCIISPGCWSRPTTRRRAKNASARCATGWTGCSAFTNSLMSRIWKACAHNSICSASSMTTAAMTRRCN